MARADFVAANAILRTHIQNGEWAQAATQLIVVRSWLAEEIESGTAEGVTFREMAITQLDAIQKEIEQHQGAAARDRRFLHTRTNYASR